MRIGKIIYNLENQYLNSIQHFTDKESELKINHPSRTIQPVVPKSKSQACKNRDKKKILKDRSFESEIGKTLDNERKNIP